MGKTLIKRKKLFLFCPKQANSDEFMKVPNLKDLQKSFFMPNVFIVWNVLSKECSISPGDTDKCYVMSRFLCQLNEEQKFVSYFFFLFNWSNFSEEYEFLKEKYLGCDGWCNSFLQWSYCFIFQQELNEESIWEFSPLTLETHLTVLLLISLDFECHY